MGDGSGIAAEVEAALRSGDLQRMSALLQSHGAEDFVQEWPQSGERLSKAAAIRLADTYPDLSGRQPSFRFRRMLDGGDIVVLEGTIDYGDGVPVSYVGIAEIRDGTVARMTEYFANPFEPPAWRAGFAERMESPES